MAITVRVIDLGQLSKFVNKDDMRAAAEELLRVQTDRVASGLGSRGGDTAKPMKPLSKEYAEAEGKTHRVRTLRRTGAMLDARQVVSVTDTQAKIGWVNAPKHAYVNQARTPFVKPTRIERNHITELVAKRVKDRLSKGMGEMRKRRIF